MKEDWTGNQRSAFSLSFRLALYISKHYGFGLSYDQILPRLIKDFQAVKENWTRTRILATLKLFQASLKVTLVII